MRSPSLVDVITDGMDTRLQQVHVALPGRVESYDANTKLANIQPLLLQRLTAEDGSVTTERLPVINSVPVVFPRGGGGFFIEFPLQAGDNVLLVFCERSLDLWKTKGGEVDPIDSRFHTYQGAVCYPGLYDQTAPATNAPSGQLAIGKIGGTFQPAARKSDKVGGGTITGVTAPTGGAVTFVYTPGDGSLPTTSTTITLAEMITSGSGSVQIS